MRRVAIISQSLRAKSCRTYLGSEAFDNLILTTDVRPFWDLEREAADIVVLKSQPSELPSAKLLNLLRRSKTPPEPHSGRARWVERAINRIVWRLRYLDRYTMLRRSKARQGADHKSAPAKLLFSELEEQQRRQPIHQIVVFDLFDLPVAVEFGQAYDVEVIVR